MREAETDLIHLRLEQGLFLLNQWLQICFLILKFSRSVKTNLQDEMVNWQTHLVFLYFTD